MSFVERNKAWLLPLLGLGALGVIVLNVKMLGPKKAPEAPTQAPPPVAPPPPSAPTPPAPTPPNRPPGAASEELWADLRPLETPWAGLNQKEAFLVRGADTIPPALRASPATAAPPVPSPAHLPRLVQAAPAARAAVAAPVAPPPPPELDFVGRSALGPVAWIQGSPVREGQQLPGGWVVQKISLDMVEMRGPGGVVRRWANPVKARSSSPSSEVP